MTDSDSGQFRSVSDKDMDKDDNEKIKIHFNLNDELKKLFGNMNNSSDSNNSDQKCPTYLPKHSIKSLCKGCDVDKL